MRYKTVTDLSARLNEIIDVFSTAAMKCVDIFFAQPCAVLDPWSLTDDFDCTADRIVTLGQGNESYQAVTVIGIGNESCFKLFGRQMRDEDFLDIFGEFANNYCALLADADEFTRRFGVLHQSVPVVHSKGMPFLPAIPGVSGSIGIEGGIVINAGFLIKRSEIRQH